MNNGKTGKHAPFLLAFAAAGAVLLSSFSGKPVLAEADAKEAKGSLTLTYYDSVDGKDPVAGAEFTCMMIGSPSKPTAGKGIASSYDSLIKGKGGNPVSIVPGISAEEVLPYALEAYRSGVPGGMKKSGRTGADGKCVIGGLRDGVYLAAETKAAEGHLASEPFIFTIPYTDRGNRLVREVSAEPKASPCGELVIEKTVSGNGGDKNRTFTFRVVLGADGPFPYAKSDGSSGEISSGGTIRLSHGQQVRITGIPAGCVYQVTEEEAGKDGYRTDSTGSSGRIRRKIIAKASFINTKYKEYERTPGRETGGTQTTQPVRTGDTSHPLLWVLTAFLSLVILAAVLYGKKKGGQSS